MAIDVGGTPNWSTLWLASIIDDVAFYASWGFHYMIDRELVQLGVEFRTYTENHTTYAVFFDWGDLDAARSVLQRHTFARSRDAPPPAFMPMRKCLGPHGNGGGRPRPKVQQRDTLEEPARTVGPPALTEPADEFPFHKLFDE